MTTPPQWLAPFTVTTGTANNSLHFTSEPRAVGLANGNILCAWNEPGTSGVGTAAGYDIIGKFVDAEGNVVIDSFLLNQSSSEDDEGDFDIAATSDGDFVLVCHEPENATKSELHWERFDASGAQTHSRNFAIESGATTDLANPQVSVNSHDACSTGSFERDLGGDIDIRAIELSATSKAVPGSSQRRCVPPLTVGGSLPCPCAMRLS